MIIIDGCDEAILGYANGHRVVYSYEKLVEVFVAQFADLPEEDRTAAAREWVDFNIVDAYLGERTPVVMFEADRAMIDEIADMEHEG